MLDRVDEDCALHLALFLLPKDTSSYLTTTSSNANARLSSQIWRQKWYAIGDGTACGVEASAGDDGDVCCVDNADNTACNTSIPKKAESSQDTSCSPGSCCSYGASANTTKDCAHINADVDDRIQVRLWKQRFREAYYQTLSGSIFPHNRSLNSAAELPSINGGNRETQTQTLHITSIEDDAIFATTDRSGLTKLWDIHTQCCISQFSSIDDSGTVTSVTLLESNTLVIASNYGWRGSVTVLYGLDMPTRQPIKRCVVLIHSRIRVIERMSSASILVGTEDCTVRLLDVSSVNTGGKCISRFAGHFGAVLCLKKRDENTFFSASSDGTVNLWDIHKEKRIGSYKISSTSAIVGIDIIDNESFVCCTTSSIQIIETVTGHRLRSFSSSILSRQSCISSMILISPRIVVIGDSTFATGISPKQNTFKVIDIVKGSIIASHHHTKTNDDEEVNGLIKNQSICDVQRVSNELVVAAYDDGSVQLWHLPCC